MDAAVPLDVRTPIRSPKIQATAATFTRIASLDGLRALAVLLVLFYHLHELGLIGWARLGWVGVDLFFVLSGFFIGLAVMRPQEWKPLTFLKRRMLRILPAYYASILLITVLVSSYFLTSRDGLSHVMSHLLLVHAFFAGHHGSINGVYWTLSVEWWFYILMLVSAPLLRSRRFFFPTIGLFLLVCYAWRAGVFFLIPRDEGFSRFFYATQLPGSLDEFVVGIVIARWTLVSQSNTSFLLNSRYARFLVPVAALLIIGAAMRILEQHTGDYWVNPFMVIVWRSMLATGFGLLLLSFLLAGPRLGQLFTHTGVAYLGMISYSIYLYHLPVILSIKQSQAASDLTAGSNMTATVIVVIATLIVSSASYHVVEARWMKS